MKSNRYTLIPSYKYSMGIDIVELLVNKPMLNGTGSVVLVSNETNTDVRMYT